MSNYENDVKEYIRELDAATQKKAVVAIQDAQKEGRDWLWVSTALRKKSVNEWEKWGFGLFFDNKFQASVYQQIERDKRCETINLDSWLSGGSFDSLASAEDLRSLINRELNSAKIEHAPLETKRVRASSNDDEDFMF